MAVSAVSQSGLSGVGKKNRLSAAMNVKIFEFPSTLSGLQAWYDASATSTITGSSTVSQWNDRSPNGYNLTQATAASQPGTGSATQNGLNVITFDGGDSLKAASAADWKFLHDGTEHLIGLVCKFGNTSDPQAAYMILETDNEDSGTGMFFFYDDRYTNNTTIHNIRNGSGLVAQNVNGNSATANAYQVYTIIGKPSNATAANRSELFLGSGTGLKSNTQTGAVSANNPSTALTLGIGNQGSYGVVGGIAELVLVSGADATEANRVALRDYFQAKWGI